MGFLPFKIVKNTKQTAQNVQQGVQEQVQNVQRIGLLQRIRMRSQPKTRYQIWMEAAAKRRQESQDRYAKMRGWK